jgi:hypothetical protein
MIIRKCPRCAGMCTIDEWEGWRWACASIATTWVGSRQRMSNIRELHAILQEDQKGRAGENKGKGKEVSWTCIPYTCLPEQAEESSRIYCLDILQLRPAKSKSIPEACLFNGKLMDFYQCFPFGTILRRCAPTIPNAPTHSKHGRRYQGNSPFVAGSREDLAKTSSAAGKGAGISGARSGLWGEMARIIGEVRPQYVFVENSPMLVCRGLERVLGDLAAMGYDAEWGVVGASAAGALITSGTESGLLGRFPTPTVCGNYNRKGASKTSGDGLATVVQRFPTPDRMERRLLTKSNGKSKTREHGQMRPIYPKRQAGKRCRGLHGGDLVSTITAQHGQRRWNAAQ